MSPENDKKLCETFPVLYAERNASIKDSCMGWGFDCDDGWFDLLWETSEKLAQYDVRAVQVKEKCGKLTIYLNTYPEGAREILAAAEAKSETICERCGLAGKPQPSRHWPKTLCDACLDNGR